MSGNFKIFENIDKFLKYMEFIKSSSKHTLKCYALDLSQTFKCDKNSNIENWTEDQLLEAIRKAFNRWAKLSLSTRNRKAATLKSYFSWAFREGLIAKDLSIGISCPKVPKKIPHFISVDEALAVLKYLETPDLLKERVLFLLLYGGGLRISEACELKWQQIQYSQRSLRIKGKGNKERLVTVPHLVIETLQFWQSKTPDNTFVFGSQALNPRTAYEMIRQCGLRTGLIKPLHPHALRHSFATHLLSSGANLRTLQELLGHESLQATEKYTHLSIDQLARTMDKLHPLGNEQLGTKK